MKSESIYPMHPEPSHSPRGRAACWVPDLARGHSEALSLRYLSALAVGDDSGGWPLRHENARTGPAAGSTIASRNDTTHRTQSAAGNFLLPYTHIDDMAFHMKTTLNIDDTVMRRLRREAARQGRTMSEMVETALRLLLGSAEKRDSVAPLPRFHSGGALVDIADRDALYDAMEGR